MKIGLKLEKVKISPCFLIRVIWWATGCIAFRTVKLWSGWEIYSDIELFRIWWKNIFFYEPVFLYIECHFKQFFRKEWHMLSLLWTDIYYKLPIRFSKEPLKSAMNQLIFFLKTFAGYRKNTKYLTYWQILKHWRIVPLNCSLRKNPNQPGTL